MICNYRNIKKKELNEMKIPNESKIYKEVNKFYNQNEKEIKKLNENGLLQLKWKVFSINYFCLGNKRV